MNDPVRVLLIDDNGTVRRCMRKTLEVLGAQVAELAALPEGWNASADAFGGYPPELAIVDLSRAGESTWRRLRACLDAARGGVPVIPISTRHGSLSPEFAERPEIAPVLPKPFTPRQLCFAAFMAQPRLRPLGGEPPFPRRGVDLEGQGGLTPFDPDEAHLDPRRLGRATTPHMAARGASSIRDGGWDVSPGVAAPGGSIFDVLSRPSDPSQDANAVDSVDILGMEEFEDLQLIGGAEAMSNRHEVFGVDAVEEGVAGEELEIIEVVEAEPIPSWIQMLVGVWPVISREGWGEVRARLVTASLTAEGVVNEAYWQGPEVAQGAADHIEVLGQSRGIQGDLAWMSAPKVLRLIRSRGGRGILEVEDASRAMRLSVHGDRLLGVEPRQRRHELMIGQLLIGMGILDQEFLDEVLALQAQEGTRTLGRLLIDEEVVTEEDINAALYLQAEGYMTDVLGMDSGHFSFRSFPTSGQVKAQQGHALSRLTLDILARSPSMSPLELGQGAAIVPNIAMRYRVEERSLKAGEREAMEIIGLGGPARDVLGRLGRLRATEGPPEALAARLCQVGLIDVVVP